MYFVKIIIDGVAVRCELETKCLAEFTEDSGSQPLGSEYRYLNIWKYIFLIKIPSNFAELRK